MKTTQLYILRHGQTDWNKQGRIQGITDKPLNTEGTDQAKQMADHFASYPLAAIYTSPLKRSQQTASIISKRHNCDLFLEKDLQEGKIPGSFEGLTKQEFKQKFQAQLDTFKTLPISKKLHFRIVPEAESPFEIADRAIRCIKRITTLYRGNSVLIVSHAWLMRSLLFTLSNAIDDIFVIQNAAYIKIEDKENRLSVVDSQGIVKGSWI